VNPASLRSAGLTKFYRECKTKAHYRIYPLLMHPVNSYHQVY